MAIKNLRRAKRLLSWVESHIPPTARVDSGSTTREQVLWFFALETASYMCDCSHKELARELQGGVLSFRTVADIQRCLLESGSTDGEIQDALAEFWEVEV